MRPLIVVNPCGPFAAVPRGWGENQVSFRATSSRLQSRTGAGCSHTCPRAPRRRPLKLSTQQIHCRDAQRRVVSVFAFTCAPTVPVDCQQSREIAFQGFPLSMHEAPVAARGVSHQRMLEQVTGMGWYALPEEQASGD